MIKNVQKRAKNAPFCAFFDTFYRTNYSKTADSYIRRRLRLCTFKKGVSHILNINFAIPRKHLGTFITTTFIKFTSFYHLNKHK